MMNIVPSRSIISGASDPNGWIDEAGHPINDFAIAREPRLGDIDCLTHANAERRSDIEIRSLTR
jgi:hypothetical protein